MSTNPKKVTSLDEIRAQAEPEIITIPGFKPDTTINVAAQTVDLTTYILETGIGNPLLAVVKKKAVGGKSREEIVKEIESDAGGISLEAILPALDAVVKEALVEPTYQELTAIRPLTLAQKLVIFEYALGEVADLQSFRGERGIREADAGGAGVEQGPVKLP